LWCGGDLPPEIILAVGVKMRIENPLPTGHQERRSGGDSKRS
jgi:hypothetical protein